MTTRICARCEFFTLERAPSPGVGCCTGYGENPVQPVVRWDAPFCVLWGREPDSDRRAKREQWIAMQKRREDEAGSVAAACENGP